MNRKRISRSSEADGLYHDYRRDVNILDFPWGQPCRRIRLVLWFAGLILVMATGAVNAAYFGRSTAEIAGIDSAQLGTSAAGDSYSFRYVLRPVGGDEKALAERTFANW